MSTAEAPRTPAARNGAVFSNSSQLAGNWETNLGAQITSGMPTRYLIGTPHLLRSIVIKSSPFKWAQRSILGECMEGT